MTLFSKAMATIAKNYTYKSLAANTSLEPSGFTQLNQSAIIQKINAIPPEDFFFSVVKDLATTLDVDKVIISECCDVPASRLKALACWMGGKITDEFEFTFENTSCEQVINGKTSYFPDNLQYHFPNDPSLPEAKAVSYAGIPIYDSKQKITGHLAFFDSKPLQNKEWIMFLLAAISSRAGAVLERVRSIEKINALTIVYSLPFGNNFFKNLVKLIGDTFDTDYAIVGQLPNFQSKTIQTAALYHRGTFLNPIEYDLEGSACATVIGQQSQFFQSNVQVQFPDCELLKKLKAEGYIGAPLFDSKGKPIGVLAIMHKKAIDDPKHIQSMLDAFSNRVSFEIEHIRNEESLRYYNGIVSTTKDLMAFVDKDYIYKAVSNSYMVEFCKPEEDIVNYSMLELHGETEFYDDLKRCVDKALSGKAANTESWQKFGDGKTHCIQGRYNPHYDYEHNITGVVIASRDITELKKAETALLQSENRLQSIYDDTPSMFFTIDAYGIIVSVNAYGARELGYLIEELLKRPIADLFFNDDKDTLQFNIENCFDHPEEVYSWELRKLHKSGKIIWVKESARVIKNANQQLQLFIVSEDISEKQKLSQELTYQASHDVLTGVYNRREFERQFQGLLSSETRNQQEHALCYLDLDQFKVINDTCGHLAGDELLKHIAGLLKLKVRGSDVLARLGGDEFGMLLRNCSLDRAETIANSICRTIEEFHFIWGQRKYSVGASIGLISIDSNTNSIVEAMSSVDAACYFAKDSGRNRVHIYRDNDTDLDRRRGEMGWVSRIKEAIDENKFQLFAQKIIAIGNRETSKPSYELLIRLQEEGEIILPGAFLPAAERYGLATKIDEWVVANAVSWLASKGDRIDELHYCTINLSGHSLGDESFLHFVLNTVQQSKVLGNKICFEITETAAIANLASATKFITQVGKLGCSFALDDFGSGVSSFGYLKNLAVDFIKIDGSFVKDMVTNPIDHAMVRSINDIAQVMNKKTIAEFVENDQILASLEKIGVDYAQGYGIGKPEKIDLPLF